MKHIDSTTEEQMEKLIRAAISDSCAEKDAAEFDALDTRGVRFKRHYRKQRNFILHQAKKRNSLYTPRRSWVRIAILTVFVTAMIAATIVGTSAIVEKWKEHVKWYDRSFSISYDIPEATVAVSASEESVETSLYTPPRSIQEERRPTYIPDFFEEDVLERKVLYMVDYYMDGEYICGFTQSTFYSSEIKFDRDEVVIYDGMVQQYDAIWMEYEDGMICLVWNDGEYIYSLICYDKMLKNEIIRMAESVQ